MRHALPISSRPTRKRRLVRAALQVFASKGYEGASTREICRLADVNVAGIHYYFGDKASLYREVFRIPEQIGPFPLEMADPNVPVRSALVAFYGHIMAYIAAPELQQLRLRGAARRTATERRARRSAATVRGGCTTI